MEKSLIKLFIRDALNKSNKMVKFTVLFSDSSWIDFTAMDSIGAKEYAEYRAKLRNTTIKRLLRSN